MFRPRNLKDFNEELKIHDRGKAKSGYEFFLMKMSSRKSQIV